MPYTGRDRYGMDSIVNEGADSSSCGVGHGAGAIHLSDEQLAAIERAKEKAGVK